MSISIGGMLITVIALPILIARVDAAMLTLGGKPPEIARPASLPKS